MELPKRKQIRLPNHDYGENCVYFITICTKDRRNVFWDVGAIINRPCLEFKLTAHGKIAEQALIEIPNHYSGVYIDKYVVMPNHIHMIIRIDSNEPYDGHLIIAPKSLPKIIQQYKSVVTKASGFHIWQKSYYEHAIRNRQDFYDIYEYIENNPAKWLDDEYYA